MKFNKLSPSHNIRELIFSCSSVNRLMVAIVVIGGIGTGHHVLAADRDTIGIMSGGVSGTYVRIAQNMSDALDSDKLRIVTMLGKGSKQNIRDLIELDSVDLAIVQSDVLREVAQSKEIPGVVNSIRYIAKLYNEEIHILVNKKVRSLKHLEGAAVGVGRKGSGTEMTAAILFDGFGLQISPVNVAGAEAIDALKNDLISAAVFVVGKPSTLLASIKKDSGLRLLEMRVPKNVEFPYFETELTASDYPALIERRKTVRTLAVGAVLAVFNWREGSRRYELLNKFTTELFGAIDQLKTGSYHPKWKNVSLKVKVPGWSRFKPANEWLQRK
jgi:uncharacterized protein